MAKLWRKVREIEILDAQPQAFHQSQAAAIEQFGHELVYARQVAEHLPRFLFGQDGGQMFGLGGAQRIDRRVKLAVEDFGTGKGSC